MFDLVVMSPFTRALGATGGVRIYQSGQHITDADEQAAVMATHRAFVVRIPAVADDEAVDEAEPAGADESASKPKAVQAA